MWKSFTCVEEVQVPRSRSSAPSRAARGPVRDVKVDRIGRVTIYRRGPSYWLYYRENGRTVRRRISGNLATARATASRVNAALEESRPTPFAFERRHIPGFIEEYLDHCKHVKGLAPRTLDRYRAALDHFVEFAEEQRGLDRLDQVTDRKVEDFVRYMRKKTRVRSGAKRGQRRPYTTRGIQFILATCRTAFNYARKRRYLPPYGENPFAQFPIEKMRGGQAAQPQMMTPDELKRFFETCDDWQFRVFFVLALYGLRVGELTHLLISDVDLEQDLIHVRSKPDMHWTVKTQRERVLPILPQVKPIIEQCIGDRQEGFLFLHRGFGADGAKRPKVFRSRAELRRHLERTMAEAQAGTDEEIDPVRTLRPVLESMGKIPDKRIRQELMKVTKAIGCPEVTRAHSLRHLFATLAQENGANPITVQGILGHSTLEMTRYYTHVTMAAKRGALGDFLAGTPGLSDVVASRGARR